MLDLAFSGTLCILLSSDFPTIVPTHTRLHPQLFMSINSLIYLGFTVTQVLASKQKHQRHLGTC